MPWEDKGGKGLWTERVNTDTGESSIKTHELKPVKHWCDNKSHDYRVVDMSKRLAECKKCKQELKIIIGLHQVDGDKVTIN